jgi:hypothetical protein
MMQSEFIVSLSDLRYVEIHCSNCSTKVTLDMKNPSELSEKHGFFAPKECPGCRREYDSAIRPAIDGFVVLPANLDSQGLVF